MKKIVIVREYSIAEYKIVEIEDEVFNQLYDEEEGGYDEALVEQIYASKEEGNYTPIPETRTFMGITILKRTSDNGVISLEEEQSLYEKHDIFLDKILEDCEKK